ncbi:low molecular weight phosphatase family protein [Bartonella tamiae]|uniref:Phosphotyrosine protein phosphatase I domain-containing protein n=1 Tax=Bartonella tamiae Th239 TaxID=1094558 RepID=J0R7C1_9HYPH|nr:low molecular weight phosphatase family protein [Bartonella tamiae]EJF91634.1 hypothetical protein ME5_00013 [Bartonella tamiae Th239]EJF92691.1 hypothetical protein MEG_01861 [Bartonella tamiae Th307]
MTENHRFHQKLPRSVLFVCSMNTIRSPLAEALTRKIFPDLYTSSAGLMKGKRDFFVDFVIKEDGLSTSPHHPRILKELSDGFFDLVVTLTPQAHNAVLEEMRSYWVNVEYWPIPDPSLATGSREHILNAYRDVRETLKKRINERFKK